MANPEHIDRLLQGVEVWNQWRKENPEMKPDLSGADLRSVKLHDANLADADFRNANLYNAGLYGTNLQRATLAGAKLAEATLVGAKLTETDLNGANLLATDLEIADLRKANLSRAILICADLSSADLSGATLLETNLRGADLSDANFDGANLKGANLCTANALGTNFSGAILTEACIQDWNINVHTNLRDVICGSVFKGYDLHKARFTNHRPHDLSKTFAPGEFAALVQKYLETVDLIFIDGIDWKAFFLSFQQLQEKYRNDNLGIQAIEKKPDGAFVIRLEVDPRADKAAIEQDSKSFYEAELKALEAQY